MLVAKYLVIYFTHTYSHLVLRKPFFKSPEIQDITILFLVGYF